MYVIDWFTTEAPHGKSPWTKQTILSLVRFVPIDQIPKIKICHIVACEHTELIEGRWWLITTGVVYYDEADEYGSFYNYFSTLYEEYESGLEEVGVRNGFTQSVTE